MEIPLALDMHTHLRQGKLLENVTATIDTGGAQLALVMPNTQPPITSALMAIDYHRELLRLNPRVLYLMTLYLTSSLTISDLEEAYKAGISGVKYYPHGLTTNSQHGIQTDSGFKPVYQLLEKMQDLGLVLNIHGEVSSNHDLDICVMNAEIHFLKHLKQIHMDFPRLKIVLEHVTTREAIECVKQMGDSVACTITVHHLELIVDDWAGKPHHFCKPVAKYPHDRTALRSMIGHQRCFLGSDSAPHLKHRKEAAECCAGVFTGAYLVPVLAHILDSYGALDHLKDFIFTNSLKFYGNSIKRAMEFQSVHMQQLGIDPDLLMFDAREKCKYGTLIREPFFIPAEIPVEDENGKSSALVPFMAGKTISFRFEIYKK